MEKKTTNHRLKEKLTNYSRNLRERKRNNQV